jgi:hypothetical protein
MAGIYLQQVTGQLLEGWPEPLNQVQVLKEFPCCSPALCFLADTYCADWARFMEQQDENAAEKAASQAVKILEMLGRADSLRARYWRVRQAQLVLQHEPL